jgi:molybdopterin-biosynthesis enzyme MoeA-like protein
VTLVYHEEGVKILERRFGKAVTTARLKMVEFPEGARLIPNPVNQIPGFSINNGHFLPGFPRMVEPMAAWILDTYYEMGEKKITRTLILEGARESKIIPLMNEFNAGHHRISLSSLPKFVGKGTEVHLGLTGCPQDVEAGITDIMQILEAQGMKWKEK